MSNPSKEPHPKENDPEPDLPMLAEARRVIEEYANDLREIVKKLRKHVD
jgi:hypothetical protein